MPSFDIICLANSTKRGGRCIAGLKIDGSGWFRPVSNRENGTLYPEHYMIGEGYKPQLFDILKIDCHEPFPKPHQPENWLISDQKWQLIERPSFETLKNLLNNEHRKSVNNSSGILNDDYNCIAWNYLQQNSAQASLCLIYVKDIRWMIDTYNGKRKSKAIFNFKDIDYDFSITDPLWQHEINYLPDGEYTSEEVIEKRYLNNDYEAQGFLLTISLGEPFKPRLEDDEYCYKLVAAVMNTKMIKNLYAVAH